MNQDISRLRNQEIENSSNYFVNKKIKSNIFLNNYFILKKITII